MEASNFPTTPGSPSEICLDAAGHYRVRTNVDGHVVLAAIGGDGDARQLTEETIYVPSTNPLLSFSAREQD